MQQRSGEWELALEQQSDLSVTQGSTAAVADSVRRGADLRVYMTTEKYEETIYFQQTYAAAGEDFAGLMSHHHGYVHHGQQVEQPNCSISRDCLLRTNAPVTGLYVCLLGKAPGRAMWHAWAR